MVGASGPPRPSVDELAAWSRPARQAAIEALFAIDDAPHKPLAAALCATDRDDVRLDLSQAFARLKPDGFVIAVAVCLARGDAQVVSLVARQVAERSAQLEAFTQDVVVERLLAARARFVSPLVTETVDDALLASSSPSAFTDLVARLGSLSPRIGAKVIVRLLGQSDDELEVIGPRVVDAVVHNRRLYLGAARLLVRVCGVMGARRARLFHAGVAILADDTVSLGDKLTALTVVDVAFVWPIAVELDVFLQLLEVAVGEPRLTVVRLLGRMGTEDAARELVKLAASSEAEVAGAAVAALASWLSPLVDVKRNDDDGQWVITPTYLDDVGVPLVLTSHAIHHPTTHQVYALDERGLVVPIGSSDDACACCERPRRWVVRAGRRVCPRTREVQPGSSSSLELHHAITDDPRPVAPPTVAPGVAELAALRTVEFIDGARRWAGAVIADDGARCALLTCISTLTRWHTLAPEHVRVIVAGREAVARRVHYESPLALYEVDHSVPALAAHVGIRAPRDGVPAFVVRPRGGLDWGRLTRPVLGGILVGLDDFASRPATGTPVFDRTGMLTALWERDAWGADIGVGLVTLSAWHAQGVLVLGAPWPTT